MHSTLQAQTRARFPSVRLAAAAIDLGCNFCRIRAQVTGQVATAAVMVWLLMLCAACSKVDPMVGDWREVENLGNVNFLPVPTPTPLDATLEIRPDGILIIREGPRSETFRWKRQDDGQAVVHYLKKDTPPVMVLQLEGEVLFIGNQGGGGRFKRAD